jgi:hypothetical protein
VIGRIDNPNSIVVPATVAPLASNAQAASVEAVDWM